MNYIQIGLRDKGKVELSWERSSALPYTSVLQLLKRECSGRPWLLSPTFLYTPPRGLIVPQLFFSKNGFSIKQSTTVGIPLNKITRPNITETNIIRKIIKS